MEALREVVSDSWASLFQKFGVFPLPGEVSNFKLDSASQNVVIREIYSKSDLKFNLANLLTSPQFRDFHSRNAVNSVSCS